MTDLMITIVLMVIAVALVVKTVFYAIEVLVNAKATRKSMKLINKYFKMLEPVCDWLQQYMKDGDI